MNDNSLPEELTDIETLQALEAFVYDNPGLEKLEAILDDFSPFSAMGWVRQEVRHSAFLRWLLDPNETHGLGAYALRAFCMRVARKAGEDFDQRPTVFEVDRFDLIDAQVMAEWENIDLTVVDEANQLVVIIENKVDSSEHSQQLQRYRRIVEKAYPKHRKIFVFLTVTGEEPSDESYITFTYADIIELIEAMLERRQAQLGQEVAAFIRQYLEMLRRHIVEDSQIQSICREIYQSHRRALDVLFEHRPDKALEVAESIMAWLRDRNDVEFDRGSKTTIRFIPSSLDFLPRLGSGSFSAHGRVVLFDIYHYDSKIIIYLVVGKGEAELRERLHEMIQDNSALFNRADSVMGPTYWSCHRIPVMTKKKYEQLSVSEITEVVGKKIDRIIESEVPGIVEAFKQADLEMFSPGSDRA